MDEKLIALAAKYKVAQSNEWERLISNYENGLDIINALQSAMTNAAKRFWIESKKDETSSKVFNALLKEANLLSKIELEMIALDEEINKLIHPNEAEWDDE